MTDLLIERHPDLPGLLIVTLNRPEKLNAITPEMHEQLQDLAAGLQTDLDTRVVLFTGAGKAFSAGADTSASRAAGAQSQEGILAERRRAGTGNRTCAALERMEQITIGAINGLAVG